MLTQLVLGLGKVANRQLPPNIKKMLEPRASEAFVANSDFMKIKGNISIVNFYEQKTTPGLSDLVSWPSSTAWIQQLTSVVVLKVVDKDSAVFDTGCAENMPLARDHRGLVRFENQDDDAYRALYQTLQRKVTKILSEIQKKEHRGEYFTCCLPMS